MYDCSVQNAPLTHKFTGKERDSETASHVGGNDGLDNFGARYNSSNLGRFMSPDPVIITPDRLKNPQQLNLYVYVMDNPLRYVDPDGAEPQGAPAVFTTNVGSYIQPNWEEIGDDSTKGHLFGGANGQGGRNADSDSLFDWNLNYSYSGSVQMDVTATFTDNEGTVTASISIPHKPLSPQAPSIGPKRGIVRQYSPLKDPNEAHGFMFKLESLTLKQLYALRSAAGQTPGSPASAPLISAIDAELKRRADQQKRDEENRRRKTESS